MSYSGRINKMIEAGKGLSPAQVEEVAQVREVWAGESHAVRNFLLMSLNTGSKDFAVVLREVCEAREREEKRVEEEKEAEKKEETEEIPALEAKNGEEKAAKGKEWAGQPELPERKETFPRPAPLAKPAPQVASQPAAQPPPVLINQDPNCGPGCGSNQLHPGRRCPQARLFGSEGERKRKAEARPDGLVRPSKRSRYQRCIGDWKCGCCGHWNVKFQSRCRGKAPGSSEEESDKLCDTARENTQYLHNVQPQAPGIPSRKGGTFRFDWYCGTCRFWNRRHWQTCNICGAEDGEACEYWDDDKNLPEKPWHPASNTGNDYGPDNQHLGYPSDYSRRSRAFVTVPHK